MRSGDCVCGQRHPDHVHGGEQGRHAGQPHGCGGGHARRPRQSPCWSPEKSSNSCWKLIHSLRRNALKNKLNTVQKRLRKAYGGSVLYKWRCSTAIVYIGRLNRCAHCATYVSSSPSTARSMRSPRCRSRPLGTLAGATATTIRPDFLQKIKWRIKDQRELQ